VLSDFRDKNRRMLPCLVDEAGLIGGSSMVFVRPRCPSCALPLLLFVAVADWLPFVAAFSDASFAADAGTCSSIGESGGGGMLVPSVRE